MRIFTLLSVTVCLSGADAIAREPFVVGSGTAAAFRPAVSGPALSGPEFSSPESQGPESRRSNAEDPRIVQFDLGQLPPAPLPDRDAPRLEPVPSAVAEPIELYPFVKYKDRDEVHPFAVETIVSVPHPATKWKLCRCCPTPMVNVQICMPPNCGPPRVKYKRLFREYEYDFGKYAVDVRLRDGRIEVDYQD